MRIWVRFLALLSGLRIQCYHELWCRLQTWLGSHVAVALAVASSCSSNSTLSLATSICHRCSPEKQKKKKKKEKKERKKRRLCLVLLFTHYQGLAWGWESVVPAEQGTLEDPQPARCSLNGLVLDHKVFRVRTCTDFINGDQICKPKLNGIFRKANLRI